MTIIIDSQFYIIDSLSLDVPFTMKCELGGRLVSKRAYPATRKMVSSGIRSIKFAMIPLLTIMLCVLEQ